MKSGLRAVGRIVIKRFEDGVLVGETVTHNKVVNGGLIWMVTRLTGGTTALIKWMKIGTSAQPVDATDKALGALAATVSVTPSHSGASIFAMATFGEGEGVGTITELGLFLDDTTMVARAVIPGQSKSSLTTFEVTWNITLQAA